MTRPVALTRELASACAWDAGNRSMRRAGRAVWARDDYLAAREEGERLGRVLGLGEHEADRFVTPEAGV